MKLVVCAWGGIQISRGLYVIVATHLCVYMTQQY
jgi:hypothetical protein